MKTQRLLIIEQFSQQAFVVLPDGGDVRDHVAKGLTLIVEKDGSKIEALDAAQRTFWRVKERDGERMEHKCSFAVKEVLAL